MQNKVGENAKKLFFICDKPKLNFLAATDEGMFGEKRVKPL